MAEHDFPYEPDVGENIGMQTENRPTYESIFDSPEDKATADADRRTVESAQKRLSERWQNKHSEAVDGVVAELAGVDATGSEALVARAAAHEAVMLDQLGEMEVELLERANLFVVQSAVSHVTTIFKTLKEVSAVRSAATQRATELVRSLSALQAQRAQRPKQERRLRVVV